MDVYNSIASRWHETRLKPWPKLEAFLLALPMVIVLLTCTVYALRNSKMSFSSSPFLSSFLKGTLIADVGCGNGRYLDVIQKQNSCTETSCNNAKFMMGCDRSDGLVELCALKRGLFLHQFINLIKIVCIAKKQTILDIVKGNFKI